MDIGFYLNIADESDKVNRIIDTLNNISDKHPYDNVILFNGEYNRIDINKKFPILHLNQAKYFRGILVVFDVSSAMITRSFPAPRHQILYVDEMFWSRDRTIPATFWGEIFDNDNISLLASNQEIYDVLSICWKQPKAIITNIAAQEIYNECEKI
jgi:hypothetical protein